IENMNKAVNSVLSPISPKVQPAMKKNSVHRFTITLKRGKAVPTEIVESPENFALEQNYPNPFNPVTSIKYAIAKPGLVSLEIYNVVGQKVATLVDEVKQAGNYQLQW